MPDTIHSYNATRRWTSQGILARVVMRNNIFVTAEDMVDGPSPGFRPHPLHSQCSHIAKYKE